MLTFDLYCTSTCTCTLSWGYISSWIRRLDIHVTRYHYSGFQFRTNVAIMRHEKCNFSHVDHVWRQRSICPNEIHGQVQHCAHVTHYTYALRNIQTEVKLWLSYLEANLHFQCPLFGSLSCEEAFSHNGCHGSDSLYYIMYVMKWKVWDNS